MKLMLKVVFSFLVLGALLAIIPGCAAHQTRDTSQLSAQGKTELKADGAVKLVNDAITAAVAANRSGVLKDAYERAVLTVAKEVLDTVAENPTTWKTLVLSAIRNGEQGLPADVAAQVNSYLAPLVTALQGGQ